MRKRYINVNMWIYIFVAFCSLHVHVVSGNDCSSSNIETNLQQCLSGIWNKATDKSAFWYGTNWLSICGYNPFAPPYCNIISQPYSPHSLLDTVYGLDKDLSQNPLTKFLKVTYHSPAGSYASCGNTYTIPESKTFDLEPLLSKTYVSWESRMMPTITWTPDEKLHTLIIFDTGADVTHGIFINIEGTNIEDSEVIKTFNGAHNPTTKKQPYVYMLFEQTNRINLTDEWRQKLSQPLMRGVYNFTDVFEELQLNGPIAMNWIEVVGDPYSIQYMVNAGLLNRCPSLVTDALKHRNLSFIPDNVDLSVSLDIEITITELEFESCCSSYKYQAQSNKLNPLGNGYISPGRSRTGSSLSMSVQRGGVLYIPFPSTGSLHTLIAFDTDVPSPTVGTKDLPLLHMLVTNINGSDLETGDVIFSYRGPAPPDYLNHTYDFFLYTQSGHLTENETLLYTTDGCSSGLAGRCLFNVTRFESGLGLNLIGASWFQSTTDEYVRYNYISSGRDADSVCNNIEGYGNPCPVGEATLNQFNILTILGLYVVKCCLVFY